MQKIVRVSLLAAMLGVPLLAAPPKTLFVGPSPGNPGTSCSSPGFSSIQAAVNAAPSGATVYVCLTASPYGETVVINKALTLTGDTGAVIQGSSTPVSAALLPTAFTTDGLLSPMAVVVVWGANARVNISNLTLSGPFDEDAFSCAENAFGVLVLAGGSVTMNGDTVSKIRASNNALLGCQNGVGIQVGRRYWPTPDFNNFFVENFVGTATITNTTVSGYEKNGITVDGPGSSASIRGNTITGDGRVDYTAQNGIQISRGASGDVRDNVVSGNAYTGTAPASSSGVVLFGGCGDPVVTGVQVMRNTLTINDVGIYLNNFNTTCDGASVTQTNDKADSNTITNDQVTNLGVYQVGIDDIGFNDKIINNDISGIGYINPANNPAGGIYIMPIDVTSFPTSAAKVHANGTR